MVNATNRRPLFAPLALAIAITAPLTPLPLYAGGHGSHDASSAHFFGAHPNAELNSPLFAGIGREERNSFFSSDSGRVKNGSGGPFRNIILHTRTSGPFKNVRLPFFH